MIQTAYKIDGVAISGPGAGQGHKSVDMASGIGLDNDMAIEVELSAPAAGALVFSFASVSKPGPALLLRGGGERDMTPEGAGAFYAAEQFLPGSEESYEVELPGGGAARVLTVPNFKAAGRYLHFWFSVPGSGGVASATANVLVLARGGAGS